ncbi:beta 1-4 rhamnosyltransferase Cps2T [Paenibacillus sp. XY044]|uniref:beta 1-4 rhamnosyltransferase Cps2T n=1 Tax=Paenibacillus sp. XY044 TaxID=2026089 RepID=UPI000B993265|nr:DUF1972 domain-containing protein [Paenibacillus sp. XY044]OZB97666.1 glycosyl transferase [Paenibacillus sp. XY044]
MKHVFIVGSKGIPAKYGGFETFVDQLTGRKTDGDTQYHVACLSDRKAEEFVYQDARCFPVHTPKMGSARAVVYDLLSLLECLKYIKTHRLQNCIVYVLACRIGPFFYVLKRQLEKLGVSVFVNPDGHEWKRGKWSAPVKRYWKWSERLMVKHADLLVCDSRGIEQYIHEMYARYEPNTTFIAYGADVTPSPLDDEDRRFTDWMERFGLSKYGYYLIIGRFVPENNYELIIREFMKSGTAKDLVIVTGTERQPFYDELRRTTGFDSDPRIKFVGTVYDQPLLKKIREKAYGYCHGHEVGGTNPSLLESLASTRLNLLFDVVFNREVGGESCQYFSKESGALSRLIDEAETWSHGQLEELGEQAKHRIRSLYSWEQIVQSYETLFQGNDYVPAKQAGGRQLAHTKGTTTPL